jgi:hypothetical protein
MSGRGYGDPERVAETGDLAGQAITTTWWPIMAGRVRRTKIGRRRPLGRWSTETVARISPFCVAELPYP